MWSNWKYTCALALQAQEDDALRLLAVASDHITAHGYTAKVLVFYSQYNTTVMLVFPYESHLTSILLTYIHDIYFYTHVTVNENLLKASYWMVNN